MPIDILNPVSSTYIFAVLLFVGLMFSLKKKEHTELLPPALSQELKGFAMLAIILAHVGYFLVSDHRFLFPLSILAGVGVDLFLFLSGFGLALSALKKKLPLKAFYLRHLPKLYVPFWIVLAVLFVADFLILKNTYSWSYTLQSFAGFFPHANLFTDINSPLWYFTFILFFYLIFPLLFLKKRPLLSALLMYGVAEGIMFLHLPILKDTEHLYLLHTIAFPLGVAVAGLYERYSKNREYLEGRIKKLSVWILIPTIIFLGTIFSYFAYFSGVGTPTQQYISLLLTLLLVILFILKPFRINLFYLLGIYSYELYLIHWPLMSRYDIFYQSIPAWLATALYIPLLLGLSWLLHTLVVTILRKKIPS
ncbi:MAG: acyltransferase [Candidatus Paceibacterota bacterium]